MAVEYYYSYDPNEHKVQQGDEEDEEDEYIDMEVSSFTHFFSLSNNTNNNTAAAAAAAAATKAALMSSQNAREFEFQMSSGSVPEKDLITSPADELFYKGKLLPLHLPPRLQMVEKLLEDSIPSLENPRFNEVYSTPLGTNAATTPFESCNVSRELNPEEYFREYGNPQDGDDQKGFVSSDSNAKKSWTKKLKTKIKSLFGSTNKSLSGCSEESCALNTSDKQMIRKTEDKEGKICHRRSFSGAFKRRSTTTAAAAATTTTTTTTKKLSSSSSSSSSLSSSSSSSSSNSNGGLHDVQLLKRSSSANNSEIESSLIQGAIAHCKQSQQAFRSRKTLSEIGFHSLASSRFSAFDDQTRPTGVCRG